MPIVVRCPHCQQRLRIPGRMAGALSACPQCQGQFQVPADNGAGGPLSGDIDITASGRFPAGAVTPIPDPGRGGADPNRSSAVAVFRDSPPRDLPASGSPAAPAPLADTSRSARIIVNANSASANLVVDGHLPELMLRSVDDKKSAAQQSRGSNPLLLVVLLCASFGASLLLMFTDFEGQASTSQRQAEARRQLASYYGQEDGPPQPYQVLLREGQQAWSRGDRQTERSRYREVLALLRAEGRGRFSGLTGTPKSDEELEKLLATLLNVDD